MRVPLIEDNKPLQRALRQGYILNEYGLVRMEDNQRVAGKTEEEIYKKLGLAFIAPELRPELQSSAFAGEPDLGEAELAELRAALEQQAADAAAAKADFDAPLG